jgi:hypothetical protein
MASWNCSPLFIYLDLPPSSRLTTSAIAKCNQEVAAHVATVLVLVRFRVHAETFLLVHQGAVSSGQVLDGENEGIEYNQGKGKERHAAHTRTPYDAECCLGFAMMLV